MKINSLLLILTVVALLNLQSAQSQSTSTMYFVNTWYNSSDCGSDIVEVYGYDSTNGCIPYTFGSYLYFCNETSIFIIHYSDSNCTNLLNTTDYQYNTCYPEDPYYSDYTCQSEQQLIEKYQGYTAMNQYTTQDCSGQVAGITLSSYPLCDSPFAVKCDEGKLYISEDATDFCVKYGRWKEYTEPECFEGTLFQCWN